MRVLAAEALACAVPVTALAVQWFQTSPGVVTFLEWRTFLLTSGVAAIVALSLAWVPADRKPFDRRRP